MSERDTVINFPAVRDRRTAPLGTFPGDAMTSSGSLPGGPIRPRELTDPVPAVPPCDTLTTATGRFQVFSGGLEDGPGMVDTTLKVEEVNEARGAVQEVLAARVFFERVLAVEISEEMNNFHERYTEVTAALGMFKPRNKFIWHWLREYLEKTMFPTMGEHPVGESGEKETQQSNPESAEYKAVSEALQTSIALDVLLDDIADQTEDKAFLDTAVLLIKDTRVGRQRLASERDPKKKAYLELILDRWESFIKQVRELPRFKEFEPLLVNAYQRLMEAFQLSMEHRFLIAAGRIHEIDLDEAEERLAHNMHIIINGIVMMMGSRKGTIRDEEVGPLMQMLANDQLLANKANDWLTYAKELEQGDISSSLILRAIQDGIITEEGLKTIQSDPQDDIGQAARRAYIRGVVEVIEHVYQRPEDDKAINLVVAQEKAADKIAPWARAHFAQVAHVHPEVHGEAKNAKGAVDKLK